jgi:hypothetical protein
METFVESYSQPPVESNLLSRLFEHVAWLEVWAVLILIVLFSESIVCSLAFAFVGGQMNALTDPSGIFVMWTIGVIGFQLAVVPTILILFHSNLRNRIIVAGFVGFAFWGAHWIGNYPWGTKFGSPDFNQIMLRSFPFGCWIVGVPLVLLTLFSRLRLKLRSDTTQGKPVTIGKLMGLTAVVAATVAYSTQLIQGDSPNPNLFAILLSIAGIAIVGALIFLIALFGIRRERNLLIYAVIRYGMLSLIAWGGLTIAANFVGRGMLMQWAFNLSIAAVSLILHSMLFTYALKLGGFQYVKVESELIT